jgi:Cu+-exporting ATPase
LSPPPTSIQISIESRSVTVQYPKKLFPTLVIPVLEDAGFDVWANAFLEADHSADYFNRASGGVNPALATKLSKHLQQCLLCQQEGHCIGYDPIISEHITPTVASGHEEPGSGPFRLALAVGGMSCSSCSMTITKSISDLQGVSDVAVSLLGGSATVVVGDKGTVEVVVKTVEDCGFDVEIMSVEPLAHLGCDPTSRRTLTLCIDGMFCQ